MKDSLIGKYRKVTSEAEARKLGMPCPFYRLDWDFRLAPAAKAKTRARRKVAASDALA